MTSTGEPADVTATRAARQARLRVAWTLGALAIVLVSAGLWPWGEPARFEQGLELSAASVSVEAERGSDVHVTLHFLARGPLAKDALVFTHLTGNAAGCRAALDTAPMTPTTKWQAGRTYIHGVQVPVPAGCESGEIEVFAGLYFPDADSARLRVLTPESADNRVLVGSTELVSAQPSEAKRTLAGRAFSRRALWSSVLPWLPMLVAFLLACAISVAAWRLRAQTGEPRARQARGSPPAQDLESPPSPAPRRGYARLLLALPAVPFLLGMLMVLEFIKDDAYISFRYAHNLVHGHGLVFNRGERLEGITNFLWTLLLAPFEALDLDLFQVCEVLGATLGVACLVLVARLTALLQQDKSDLGSYLWGAFWLASSSSFVLYANSGLEQPLAALLPCAGAFVLYRSRAQSVERDQIGARGYASAGLLLGAGCLVRPELHLSALLVALPAIVDVLRARKITRRETSLLACVLALTVPTHLFRFLYYGTLIPNTFYVKTSSDGSVLLHGLDTLRDMFAFNYTGLLLVLAPFAFLQRGRTLEKLSCLLISLAFLVYYARVGVDEMHWHRLYIPALPFAAALAAVGCQNLLRALSALLVSFSRRVARVDLRESRARWALSAAAWIGLAFWVYSDMRVTYEAERGFNGHGDLAGTYHPDMGKFLVRHERPGGLVAFQDMGSTPYYAPDLNFLDFFGLVDKTVAHARHGYGLHTFISGDPYVQRAYDAEMREYFFKRDPEWTILTVYASAAERDRVSRAFDQDPTGAAFGDFYRNNSVQFGLWDDPRFRQRYVPVRTWARSSAYYLALWRRRDLWQQTPREVVLDAAPARAAGSLARFAGGLELLGFALTPEAHERHEAFVTSWWRLPGPMPHDLMFFVHFVRPSAGTQLPCEHVPGDWMYPAERWQQGQILEDRTLFQLPPETMPDGEYHVYLGAYRRTTGERLKISSGATDGQDRVPLGLLRVKPLLPLIHDLIPRTQVETMRAHPERIVQARPEVAEASRP